MQNLMPYDFVLKGLHSQMPLNGLKRGILPEMKRKTKETAKNQVRYVGRLMTVFNKIVILGLVPVQNLIPDNLALNPNRPGLNSKQERLGQGYHNPAP